MHPRERNRGKIEDAQQKQNKLLHVTETFSGCTYACAYTHTRTRQLTVSKATSKISFKKAQLLLYPDFVFKDLAKPKEWPEKKKKKKNTSTHLSQILLFQQCIKQSPCRVILFFLVWIKLPLGSSVISSFSEFRY